MPAWMLREGAGLPAPPGQWLSFDEGAYEQVYRERLAARPEASAPLNKLARLYGQPVQQLLGAHPALWTLATQDHALNAGPPPRAGMAMGDARALGQLDLYLADPFITELRTRLGGTPAAPTSGLALEQQRLHGAERYAELTRLDQALATVRQAHADAMRAAREGGGAGWVDVPMQTGTDPETGWPTGVYETVGEGEIVRDAQGLPVLATTRVFDPARFSNAWLDDGLRRGDLAARVFEQFYGRAHSQIVRVEDHRTDSAGRPQWEARAHLDNPALGLDAWVGTHDTELVALDLNQLPRLNNDTAIGFDPQLGWVTPRDNLYEHRSWFDKAMPIAFVAFTAWLTAGATTGMGWVGGAITGAVTSTASGVVNGNLSLKGVLIGAVSGALTASLTPGLTNTLKDAGLGAASGIAARMTVQGGIQALLGGKFKDGAIAGFASGLADLASANIGDSIKQAIAAGTMTPAEAIAARSFNTMLSSAIRAAGSPGDPAQAFAQEWLGALMQEYLPSPAPAPAPPATDPAVDEDRVQTFPVPDPSSAEVRPLPPTSQAERVEAAQATLDTLAQQYGDLDRIPASVLRELVQPIVPRAEDVDGLPLSLEPTQTAGLGLQGVWAESTKNISIAGGYVAGLLQGVGDTVIGLGKLADTLLKAQLYVSGLGEVGPGRYVSGGREAYQELGKISAAVGEIARDPGFYLGRAVDYEISSIANTLNVANASDARGDWFLYGASVGRVTFDVANLVLGAGALAQGATTVAARLEAFVDTMKAARPVELALDLSRSGIGAVQELQPVVPTVSGSISATKVNSAGYSLIDLTPAERNAALHVMTQGDQAGTVTEGLVNSISQRQGWNSLQGGKYGSNNGFDHVLEHPNGTVTVVLDSKQITNGSTSLSPDGAGGTMQMSDAWVRQVLNNLDPTSSAYRAVNNALNNGTLVKGVIGVDRATGQVVMIRVN